MIGLVSGFSGVRTRESPVGFGALGWLAMSLERTPSWALTGLFIFLLQRSIKFFARSFQGRERSEEHTSELQSLMRISYAVFCLKKKNTEISKIINFSVLAAINISRYNTPKNIKEKHSNMSFI